MLILMRTTLAGPKYNCTAGNRIEVDPATAKQLIQSGYAEPVQAKAAPVETAMSPDAENAAIQPGGKKKK